MTLKDRYSIAKNNRFGFSFTNQFLGFNIFFNQPLYQENSWYTKMILYTIILYTSLCKMAQIPYIESNLHIDAFLGHVMKKNVKRGNNWKHFNENINVSICTCVSQNTFILSPDYSVHIKTMSWGWIHNTKRKFCLTA